MLHGGCVVSGLLPAGCDDLAAFASSESIAVTGTGTESDPYVAAPITPTGAVVPHGWLPGVLPNTLNGIESTATGLMAPAPGFPAIASAYAAAASMPNIVANTAGQITWGPVITVNLVNVNTDRALYHQGYNVFPVVRMVLQSGATGKVGNVFDPLGVAGRIQGLEFTNNSGAAVEIYQQILSTFVATPAITLPSATTTSVEQMWVELTGATGASSITTVLQAGMRILYTGVPI